jgi:hypothetical protein
MYIPSIALLSQTTMVQLSTPRRPVSCLLVYTSRCIWSCYTPAELWRQMVPNLSTVVTGPSQKRVGWRRLGVRSPVQVETFLFCTASGPTARPIKWVRGTPCRGPWCWKAPHLMFLFPPLLRCLPANCLIHWSSGVLTYTTTRPLLSKDFIAPKFLNFCVSGL